MNIGQKYLITCDNWFIAPDGDQYRAVFGTVHAIVSSEEALGIKTNAKSTNWYVIIGDMVLAGCQIHYATRTNQVSLAPARDFIDHEGKRNFVKYETSRIYHADLSGFIPGV
jgi:hypothetical protein